MVYKKLLVKVGSFCWIAAVSFLVVDRRLPKSDPTSKTAVTLEINSLLSSRANQVLGSGTEGQPLLSSMDPKDILGYSNKLDDEAIIALFALWAETEPDSAMLRAADLTGDRKLLAYQGIAEVLSVGDPALLIQCLDAFPSASISQPTMAAAFQRLQTEIEESVEIIETLPNRLKGAAVTGLAKRMVFERGVDGALKWALESSDAGLRQHAIDTVLGFGEHPDPILVGNYVKGSLRFYDDPREKVIDSLSSLGASEVYSWIAEYQQEDAYQLTKEVAIASLLRHGNASGALQLAGKVKGSKAELLDSFFESIGDIREVAELIDSAYPTGIPRELLLRRYAANLASIGAGDAVTTLKSVNGGDECLQSLAQSMIENGQHYDLVNNLDLFPAEDRGLTMRKVLIGTAKESPGEALRLLSGSSTVSRTDGLGIIAGAWAQSNPRAAADWASKLSLEDRTAAYSSIVKEWVQYDSREASQWIGNLPAGSATDSAIQTMVRGIKQEDPSRSIMWALSMSDSSLSAQLVGEVISELPGLSETDHITIIDALSSGAWTGYDVEEFILEQQMK